MKNNLIKNILLVFAFFVSIGIYAQSVSGVVTSEDGPLPGATVQVKGTSNGVSTDFDGNFTIQADASDVLMVSFVGFSSQEVTVGDQDNLTIHTMLYPFITFWLECLATTLKLHVKSSSGYAF